MKQHKWHKEIKAWADGAEIEHRVGDKRWILCNNPSWGKQTDYRIKPTVYDEHIRKMAKKALAIPEISDAVDRLFEAFKEPEAQYLYVYQTLNGIELCYPTQIYPINNPKDKFTCIGKIKLEVDDE